jgi:hypothetical protein
MSAFLLIAVVALLATGCHGQLDVLVKWLPSASNANSAPSLPVAVAGAACSAMGDILHPTQTSILAAYSGGELSSFVPTTAGYSATQLTNFRTYTTPPLGDVPTPLEVGLAYHGMFTYYNDDYQAQKFEMYWGGLNSSGLPNNDIWVVFQGYGTNLYVDQPWQARYDFKYACTVDSYNFIYGSGWCFMYGGLLADGTALDDAWNVCATPGEQCTSASTRVFSSSPWGGARVGMGIKFSIVATEVVCNNLGVCNAPIVALGGINSGYTTYYNDVWYSTTSGSTWSKQSGPAPWSPRYGPSTWTGPNNHVFVYGGIGSAGNLNDLWISNNNGINWVNVVQGPSSSFAPTIGGVACTMTVFLNTSTSSTPVLGLVALGGYNADVSNTLGVLQVTYT